MLTDAGKSIDPTPVFGEAVGGLWVRAGSIFVFELEAKSDSVMEH